MRIERKATRRIRVGEVEVGGGAPVSVQTMTSTDTRDAAATLAQVGRARQAGCDIVRVAVPDRESAEALPAILAGAGIPVIADIHFDHRLALAAVEAGVDGLRINPGNIGGEGRVREVARAAVAAGIPIRVGVNAGSLSKEMLSRHGGPTPQALVESALREVEWLEKYGCRDVKISVKASSVGTTVDAYRELSRTTGYPLHVGVSEAGPRWSGTIKSALGIGILLSEGIGDTIRVSLSADPVEEVRVGRKILSDLGLAPPGLRDHLLPDLRPHLHRCGRIVQCAGRAAGRRAHLPQGGGDGLRGQRAGGGQGGRRRHRRRAHPGPALPRRGAGGVVPQGTTAPGAALRDRQTDRLNRRTTLQVRRAR